MCEATGSTPGELFDLPREEFLGIRTMVIERAEQRQRDARRTKQNVDFPRRP